MKKRGKEPQLKDNYLLERGHNFQEVYISVKKDEERERVDSLQCKCQTLALTFCNFLVVLLLESVILIRNCLQWKFIFLL